MQVGKDESHKSFPFENLNRIYESFKEDMFMSDAQKYVCQGCGYIYDPAKGDPDNGVKPGTAFADLPEDWTCPDCGVDKSMFEPYNE